MNFEQEKKFYININVMKYCYPSSVSRFVEETNFGVLEQYKNKNYTLQEINEIIAELIMKQPYIPGSMTLKLSVSSNLGYHHILDFKNYWYKEEKQSDDQVIRFRF